jgi:hypothetical protein
VNVVKHTFLCLHPVLQQVLIINFVAIHFTKEELPGNPEEVRVPSYQVSRSGK